MSSTVHLHSRLQHFCYKENRLSRPHLAASPQKSRHRYFNERAIDVPSIDFVPMKLPGVKVAPKQAQVSRKGGITSHIFLNPIQSRLAVKFFPEKKTNYHDKRFYFFIDLHLSHDFKIKRNSGPIVVEEYHLKFVIVNGHFKKPKDAFKSVKPEYANVGLKMILTAAQ